MIFFNSIQRHINSSDPSGKVVLTMYTEDVSDLCHILWKCRDQGLLADENEKMLQLEFQSLRHLLVDGSTCDPFEFCSIHDQLEKMGLGDKRQGIDNWYYCLESPKELPATPKEVLVKLKDGSYHVDIYEDGAWHNSKEEDVEKWRNIED